ncbi:MULTISPECIES: hypothetical protein [Pseudomonas]
MSTDLVGLIHERLREEIDRCGLSLAAASRAANESSPQRLKDVVSGRQKCPADLVANLLVIGVDAMYVLTGDRTQHLPSKLAPDEEVLLDGYRALDTPSKKRALAAMLTGEITALGESKQASRTNTQTVSGSGHRVAGRDFNTKE